MSQVISVRVKNLRQHGYPNLITWLQANPDHLYIGRYNHYVPGAIASKWANPFPVKKHGLDECLRLYREYISENNELLGSLDELEGKVLGCWCREPNMDPEIPVCHGDILLELLAERRIKKIKK